MVKWRLKELIGEYQGQSGQTIRYEDISKETGLSPNTLSLIGTNKARRADLDTVDGLLGYMSKALGRKLAVDDLLRFTTDEENEAGMGNEPAAPAPKASDAARQTQRSALAPPAATATPQQLAAEAERRQMLLDQAKGRQ